MKKKGPSNPFVLTPVLAGHLIIKFDTSHGEVGHLLDSYPFPEFLTSMVQEIGDEDEHLIPDWYLDLWNEWSMAILDLSMNDELHDDLIRRATLCLAQEATAA